MKRKLDHESISQVKRGPSKKPKRKKHVLRKLILFLLILLILAGTAYYVIQGLKSEYTVNYQAYTATTGTISNSLSFSGTLQTINNMTYTAESDALIRQLYVSKGSTVKSGDVMLRYSSGKTVTADFDGKINQLNVAVGDTVTAGTSLMQLVDFEHMKISIRVDEYDISDVKIGDECRVTTTATEDTFTSHIEDINYISSSAGSVAYYTATAYVDVKSGVYPGMQVTVTIPKEEASDVVILKEDALSFDQNNQAFIYMLTEDGALDSVYVSTGVSNGNYVEIKSGLASGDIVYAQVQAEETSTGNIFSSLFGSQNIMGGSQPGTRSSQSGRNGTGSGTYGTGTRSGNPGTSGGSIPGGGR